jgi:nitroreductase
MKPIDDSMGVMDAIRRRRSIRKFRPDPVPEPAVRELLEAARLAPSGGNSQPWRFMVVTDTDHLKKLAKLSFDQRQMREAPAVIVCCGDLGRLSSQSRAARREELDLTGVYEDIGLPKTWFLERETQVADLREFVPRVLLNVAIAIEHIVLRATSLGLGTCWIGAFDQAGVSSYLGLPQDVFVAALLPLGYPAQDPRPRPRFPMEEIVLPAPPRSAKG